MQAYKTSWVDIYEWKHIITTYILLFKNQTLLLKHSFVYTECLMYSNIKVQFYTNDAS